jgi:hypothetical protein
VDDHQDVRLAAYLVAFREAYRRGDLAEVQVAELAAG